MGEKHSRNFGREICFFLQQVAQGRKKTKAVEREGNEALKLLPPPQFLRLSPPPFSRKKNKKRPSIGHVFLFETQVQRHWEIWAHCEGLRVMMRGEEQHPIPNSFLAYSAQNLSKPSAVGPRHNPHKSRLAGEKLFPVFKWAKVPLEWTLLADC